MSRRGDSRRPFRLLDAADVLHDAALPDDDSTLEAEDALDDEAWLLAPSRAGGRPPCPSGRGPWPPPTGGAWAATSDGLYRVTPEGCRRAALAGRDLLALAASESKRGRRLGRSPVPGGRGGSGERRR